MKFPYHVYHNDVLYEPFEEVPIEEDSKAKDKETEDVEVIDEIEETEEIEEKEETVELPVYTKTEINRMPVAKLKVVARLYGYDPNEMTGADIKKALINKLNL